jgi:hypothetical protein
MERDNLQAGCLSPRPICSAVPVAPGAGEGTPAAPGLPCFALVNAAHSWMKSSQHWRALYGRPTSEAMPKPGRPTRTPIRQALHLRLTRGPEISGPAGRQPAVTEGASLPAQRFGGHRILAKNPEPSRDLRVQSGSTPPPATEEAGLRTCLELRFASPLRPRPSSSSSTFPANPRTKGEDEHEATTRFSDTL